MDGNNTRNAIILHEEKDNVAIALRDLTIGEAVRGVSLVEKIPRYHKVAIDGVEPESPVLKYGQIIGYATQRIEPGAWVHSHNMSMGRLFDQSKVATEPSPPADLPRIGDRFFSGFRARDGRAGTRNYIVIASMVDCSARVVEIVVDELNRRKEWFSRRFPNVDGVIGLTHDSGCGVVALSPGHIRQNLTMRNLLDHPNVGGRVVVQLGCEKSQAALVFGSERVIPFESARETDESPTLPAITIQDEGGTWPTVEKILRYVETVLFPQVNRRRRVLIPAAELIVAMQCGGSNAVSGFTANAAIGFASDLIVRCDGTTFIGETTETFGAGHLLTRRARTRAIAQLYLDHVAWYEKYLERGDGNAQANLAHGNMEGGLTTIAEKSLGSVAKGGTSALEWVNDYAERITAKGFGFMNSPAYDPASATGQTAGGALVGVFSTGAGSCFGGLLIPWIKVVSNTDTFNRMEDMEINAGTIADGEATVEDVGRLIFEQIIACAGGARTYSEKLGYSVVNIWNSGVVT
ncbi:MAG: altronate dehydratase [Spirochaetaceae bacterium]|nr:MAG: altronate dehydratase [Spirochaetaceae bacterium]